MQHDTFNDFPIGTSCCFPNSTFNDFSMTHLGICCAREQKSKKWSLKIVLENKLFMDTLLLLPLEKQNLSSNSHLNLYLSWPILIVSSNHSI